MRTLFISFCTMACSLLMGQDWKPAGNRILTEWAAKVDPGMPHPEYPRPQMKRDGWLNLNGLWDYCIRYKDDGKPSAYAGRILVPFAVESALSGVGRTVGENNVLWYRRNFTVPSSMKGKKILLHFGAVDWEAEVMVNGKLVGRHQGGYDPFSFDISAALHKSGTQELVVRVWDPTDLGPQPRGKQVGRPEGIWYTPVTGIWQTVWLEAVPETFVASVYAVPDLATGSVTIVPEIRGAPGAVSITVFDKGSEVTSSTFDVRNEGYVLKLKDPKSWTPSSPHLYDYILTVKVNGKTVDEVKGYFGMRSINLQKDNNGIQWVYFNNEFLFQYGPLDQGWWPDGLYTAPTAEALKYDILRTRDMGFNMIRKHVKVEPALWYRYCDSIGIIVWQDMPSGDNVRGDKWITNPSLEPQDKTRTEDSEKIYRTELKAMLDALRSFTCIGVWVPFNEAWGQFKTVEISNWVKSYDPGRLVNPASGGNFHAVGDMHDLHNYPDPMIHRPEVFGRDRAVVLGEFGGLGLPVEGHTWTDRANWGYQSFGNREELLGRYRQLIEKLLPLIPKGLSAAVYTQTTDVETEVNGLMTYDRKVIKFNINDISALNKKLYEVKPKDP